jgi:hypothetical protein
MNVNLEKAQGVEGPNMTIEISPQAAAVTAHLIRESLPNPDARVRAEGERLDALPIGWDLWSYWFLRPSGEVVVVDLELEVGKTEYFTSREQVLSALVMGARWYPELRELLPERGAGAQDCECREIPIFRKVICGKCRGLGWLPAGPTPS